MATKVMGLINLFSTISNVLFLFLLSKFLLVLSQNGLESFEIESAVIRCLNPEALLDDDDLRVVNWKLPPLTSFNTPIKPGPHEPNSALSVDVENDLDLNLTRRTNCKTQAVITIKVIQQEKINLENAGALIKIDHMLDELTGKAVSLGNPLAIKIQQGPFFAVYPLHYWQTVNAMATEVITNHTERKNLAKCSGDICGEDNSDAAISHKGFCCSCEDSVTGQLRGGHHCGNSSKDQEFYSTHCFRYSDHWYAAFQIGLPQIFQQVYIQVYESREKEDGTAEWKVAGEKGQIAKINSQTVTNFEDGEDLGISYRKVMHEVNETIDKLNSAHNVLLIPTLFYASTRNDPESEESLISEGVDKHYEIYRPLESIHLETKSSLPPPLLGGIDESVLVVPKTVIGGKCSQAGVTPRAFYSQPMPCGETEGTCLRNQPFDLWDLEEKNSSDVHYRLKNFGKVHQPAPFKRLSGKMHFVMEHQGKAAGYIDIQRPADDLEVMRPGYNAQVVSIISGCTSSGGKLIVEVANTEYVSASFSVHVLSCTDQVPLQKSATKVIDALRIETFQLDLHFGANLHLQNRATCSVGVLNEYHDVVAFRMVTFSPGDTCICSLNCKCTCAEDPTFNCVVMSDDEIISAGFLNPEEFNVEGDEVSDLLDQKNLTPFLILCILLLLILGLLKAILGRLCWRSIGKLGLCYFQTRPRKLNRYLEREYSNLEVIYDQRGSPVDPFTKRCTVETLNWWEEAGLNLIFFIILPILAIGYCCCWCCRPRDVDSETIANSYKSSPEQMTNEKTRPDAPSMSPNFVNRENGPAESASHRTLFSSNGTPYGSWHKIGQEDQRPQGQKVEEKSNPLNSSSNQESETTLSGGVSSSASASSWEPTNRKNKETVATAHILDSP